MPRKLLSLKATAVAVVAVLSIGGVAAATGLVSVQLVAGHAPTASRGASAAHAERGTAVAVDSRSAGEAALGGLCRAYLAGQGGQNGRREDSPAFRALAAAAGGADKIAAYCRDTAPGGSATHQQGQGAPSSTGSGQGQGQGQGQGSPPSTTPAQDQGQGGPPTTTG